MNEMDGMDEFTKFQEKLEQESIQKKNFFCFI